MSPACPSISYFYPRPPRGGRHRPPEASRPSDHLISIHALREEGDRCYIVESPDYAQISIHALREEGDSSHRHFSLRELYFYPRPPRGGRLGLPAGDRDGEHFYPRPPRGGRLERSVQVCVDADFYPRPPRGGRLSPWDALLLRFEFLSTPSARRATAKTETKSLFSYKLYNILHEFRRALIYNGSKNYPNHAK